MLCLFLIPSSWHIFHLETNHCHRLFNLSFHARKLTSDYLRTCIRGFRCKPNQANDFLICFSHVLSPPFFPKCFPSFFNHDFAWHYYLQLFILHASYRNSLNRQKEKKQKRKHSIYSNHQVDPLPPPPLPRMMLAREP